MRRQRKSFSALLNVASVSAGIHIYEMTPCQMQQRKPAGLWSHCASPAGAWCPLVSPGVPWCNPVSPGSLCAFLWKVVVYSQRLRAKLHAVFFFSAQLYIFYVKDPACLLWSFFYIYCTTRRQKRFASTSETLHSTLLFCKGAGSSCLRIN